MRCRRDPECWRCEQQRSAIGRAYRRGYGACVPRPSCPHQSPAGRAQSPFLGSFATLAVNDCHRWARFASSLFAHRDVKCMMDALQRAVPVPQHEVIMRGAFRRQILGQRLPLASGPKHVEDRVQSLSNIDRTLAPAVPSRRNHRLDQRPFGVGQITRIAQATSVSCTAVFMCPHRALFRESVPSNESQMIHST
jgi:hypothetical protein